MTTLGATNSTTPLPPDNLAASAAPTATDDTPTYDVGSFWYDTTNDRVYICKDNTSSAAKWEEIGPGEYVTSASTFTTTSTSFVLLTTMTITPGVVGKYEATFVGWMKAATTGQQGVFGLDVNAVQQEQWQSKVGTTDDIDPVLFRARIDVTNAAHAVRVSVRATSAGSQVEVRQRHLWLRRLE